MNLLVLKEEIIEGLQKGAGIIPARTGAAFLRTIWLRAEQDALQIMSTDSNLEFCGTYPAKVKEEGLVGVQGKKFYDLLKKLPPGEISISTDKEETLLIAHGRKHYKLPTNDASWFQNFAKFPAENAVLWSGDFLREIIERIVFCISDEDNMEAMKCMKIAPGKDQGSIEVCGLNGHQFALFSFINPDIVSILPENGVLIYKKYLLELRKWITMDEIEINISDKRLFFSSHERKEVFSLPLSYYEYPKYENFLQDKDNNSSLMQVSKMELIDCLERIFIFNTDHQICTYFSFQNSEIVLQAQGHDVGTAQEVISCNFEGSLKQIAFPTRKIIEILSHYNSDTIHMKLIGQLLPCIITGDDDQSYLTIIMPMEISEETYYTEENV